MDPQTLVLLTAAFVVAAIVALAAAVVAWRRVSAARGRVNALVRVLEDHARLLPLQIKLTARPALAERAAALEHAMWTVTRFDEQLVRATVGLAAARGETDRTRERLLGARASIERLRSAGGLIMRVIELRRATLR